jgi:uncharacterized protein YdaU (DUF1376 family)
VKKQNPPVALVARPFFKCYPSNFLAGCIRLSPEQKAVYYTLIMTLYDRWQPIDDHTVKQRQDLARFCGCSTRSFTRIRDELLAMPEKLFRDADGHLTNRKFERERAALGTNSSQIDAEKNPTISKLNGQLNGPASNDPKGLRVSRTRASPESRVQTEQNRAGNSDLTEESTTVVESEIGKICSALGVSLQASVHRHSWAYRWTIMRTQLDITVDDMVAAIDTYRGQINFEDVRSLGLFKDRAIEKRVARTLNDRLVGRAAATAPPPAELSDEQWQGELRRFLRSGSWAPSRGPSPLQPGCRAPQQLLDQARRQWIAQDQHPERMTIEGVGEVTWRSQAGGPVRTPTPFAPRSS